MKRLLILFFIFFDFIASFAKENNIDQAIDFFNQKQYSLAQSIFSNIDSETALFFNAKCSEKLQSEDTRELFIRLINDYPFSLHYNDALSSLANIYYHDDDYPLAISFYLRLNNDLSKKQQFNLAYSYFQLDSLETAKYYFSKLLEKESDYQSASKYYFAHISYDLENYQSSLKWFKDLRNDKKFKNIVPYYIAQIYYHLEEYAKLIEYLEPIIYDVVESRKVEVNRLLGGAFYRVKDYLNAVKYLKIFLDESTSAINHDYFMLGFSNYQISDYLSAVDYLNQISIDSSRLSQMTSYYLGASYLRLNKNNFALQAFKSASSMDFDITIKEESYFNYAKLAYELDLPFENALSIFNDFNAFSNNTEKKDYINSLSVSLLKGTSNFFQAYSSLRNKTKLSSREKFMLQELAFFLAVQEFNNNNFDKAIIYFKESIEIAENEQLLSAAQIWLADAFYQIGDYQLAQNVYSNQSLISSEFLYSLNLYNKGYTFFKLANYTESAKVFRAFIKVSDDSMFLNDAYLRIADSYYMNKDFVLAEKYYKKSFDLNLFDLDYSLYQRSICMGVLDNKKEKIKLLEKIILNHNKSTYYDDALFLIAEHKKNSNMYSDALSFYDSVLVNTSEFNLKAKSHLGRAMIFFNNDDIEKAISEYKLIVDKFQSGTYFKEALLGLKSIYVGIAKVDEYISFINTIPNYRISESEQDSLSYNAAFIKFSEQDFNTSKDALKKYIEEFENGIFINDAYYYLAYSYLNTGDSVATSFCFSYLVENNVAMYLENSLIYLARDYFNKNDYENSNIYYTDLEKIVSNNSIKREVVIRLMYGFELIDNKKAMQYANKVLELEKTDNWLVSKAKIIISRYDFDSGNYNKARNLFKEILSIDNNSDGAEAMYNLIYLTFLDDSLDLAEKLIFEMPDQFSDDFYIAKSFILLSDIYLKKENKFQAKATLESIIDNYDGDDLKIIAQKKREDIIESDVKIEKSSEETYYIDIFEEDLDYDLMADSIK